MLSRFADSRIVVIDDDAANLDLLDAMLRRAGLRHIHAVQDPRGAFDVLLETEPDLVLLDLHMPTLDGFVLLDQIVTWAAGGYLPVLVLTADTSTEAAHAALSAGARDFLTKPFNMGEVLLRVGNLLETRQLHQRLRRTSDHLAKQLHQVRRHEAARQATREATRADVCGILSSGGPTMVFQPVIDLATDRACGYEALARFNHESTRTPAQWFDDASHVGLGSDLELAAAERALKTLPLLADGTFLGVNVSPGVLMRPELRSLIPAELGSRVVLELTEHTPVEDYPAVLRALEPLRDIGVRLAVDDTGAGYASLRHILALEPDVIKLDLSLVRDIDHDPARRALAAALVAFAKEVNVRVVAEGVETTNELHVLRVLGVHWAQGFHLGRPAPRELLSGAGQMQGAVPSLGVTV